MDAAEQVRLEERAGDRALPREQASAKLEAGHTAEASCLNCGAVLLGTHCHQCGQKAHLHRTLSAFFHDLLHGLLHWEGKTWRTVKMLAWHPGRLTREYIDGRRKSYVGPVAMFLFTVFLSFAVFQFAGGSQAMLPDGDADPVAAAESAFAQYGERLAEARWELQTARAEDDREDVTELTEEIGELERERTRLAEALRIMGSDAAPQAEAMSGEQVSLGEDVWNKVQKNPQLVVYKMQTNAYKFAWLLIPLSVPFVWLLYCWRRKFKW